MDRLISAFAAVRKVQGAARLVIVGSGPDEAALKAQAERTGVADSITWTGDAEGARMMAGFDIFALASRYEAFPYVLLEATARGLPIVSTRVGGVDELVRDEQNGMVVEQGDIAGYTRRLESLVEDGDRRRAMGEESQRIVQRYGVDNMVRKTMEVYAELIRRYR